MMRRPDAVVFDLDQALSDTEQAGQRVAFNRAFARLGLPVYWDEQKYALLLSITTWRRRVTYSLRAAGLDRGAAESLAAAIHRVQLEELFRLIESSAISARAGADVLMAALSDAGIPIGLVAGGSSSWVRPLVCSLFPTVSFAAIVTGSDIRDPRPHPDGYLTALHRLEVDRSGVVAVEGSPDGASAARSAGITSIHLVDEGAGGLGSLLRSVLTLAPVA